MTTQDIPGTAIGLVVRELREAAGWSLSKLAKQSGISRSNVYDIEQGEVSPTYATILKLCAAFGCRPAILTDGLMDIERERHIKVLRDLQGIGDRLLHDPDVQTVIDRLVQGGE